MNTWHGLFHWIATHVFHLGGLGLFLVGIADSSFLAAPLANDLLLTGLTATHPVRLPYYVLAATMGSVSGCAIVDALSRKAGESVNQGNSSHWVKSVQSKLRKHAGWTIAVAAVLPPPFPFTPFVIAAASSQYPRRRLLAIIGTARLVRFSIEGVLAIAYGSWILSIAQSSAVRGVIIVLVIVAVAGSAASIVRWILGSHPSRRGRRKSRRAQ